MPTTPPEPGPCASPQGTQPVVKGFPLGQGEGPWEKRTRDSLSCWLLVAPQPSGRPALTSCTSPAPPAQGSIDPSWVIGPISLVTSPTCWSPRSEQARGRGGERQGDPWGRSLPGHREVLGLLPPKLPPAPPHLTEQPQAMPRGPPPPSRPIPSATATTVYQWRFCSSPVLGACVHLH